MRISDQGIIPDEVEAPGDASRSRTVLAAMVLTVVNGLLAVAFFGAWMVAGETAVQAVQITGGVGLFTGMAGVAVGGWIQFQRKRAGLPNSKVDWSTWTTVAGLAAMGVFLLIPMSAALQAMTGTGAPPVE